MNPFRKMFGIDYRSLAAFRVSIGVILLLDLYHRALDLTAHYTDFGLLPRSAMLELGGKSNYFWSLHAASGGGWLQIALFLFATLAAIAFTLGYRTKWAAIVSWLLLISLQTRNGMVLNGGDVLLRCLMFWAMFLPLGAYYSIDRALQTDDSELPPDQTSEYHLSLGTFAILFQLTLLYVATGLMKDSEYWWPKGTATYMALSVDHFATPFGVWMRQHYELLRYSTYATIVLERCGTLLFYSPVFNAQLRLVAALSFIGLHAGIASMMEVGLFPYIDMASMLLLIDKRYWTMAGNFISGYTQHDINIYYDPNCGFCRKSAYIVQVFLGYQRHQVLPADQNDQVFNVMKNEFSWVIHNKKTGDIFLRWDGLVTLLRSSPILGIFARYLPFGWLKKAGDTIYNFVAFRRDQFGAFSERFLPYRKQFRPRVGYLASAFILLVLFIVTADNTRDVYKHEDVRPLALRELQLALRMDQTWKMFAPFPMKDDGWFVIQGRSRKGEFVDPYHLTWGKLSFTKPDLVSSYYSTQRWRKYLMNLWQAKHKRHRLYFGRWLCRRWNGMYEKDEQMLTFRMYYVREDTIPEGGTKKPRKVPIWRHNCFDTPGVNDSQVSH